MKSVLFDSRSAYLNRLSGWERVTQELGKRLVGVHDGITVHEVRTKTHGPLELIASDLMKMPRMSKNFDLVHFPTFPPVKVIPHSQPRLYTLHDLTWWKYPKTASTLGKHYYKSSARRYIDSGHPIITVSETVRQEILEYFEIDDVRVTTIYPGVEGCTCSSENLSGNKPFLLTVGTIEPRKNLPLLIKAYEASRNSDLFDLKIVGRFGWGEKLPRGVKILSDVNDGELHKLYSQCFAVIQPSLYEGFGLPLIEALVHGKLLVCSDIPVFREIVKEYGIFVDPNNLSDWVDVFNNLFTFHYKPKESQEFASRYNWDKSASQTLELYMKVLA